MRNLGILATLKVDEQTMQAAGCPLIGGVASYDVNVRAVERSVFRTAMSDAGYAAIGRACVPVLTHDQALGAAVTQCKPPKRLAVLEITVPSDKASAEYGIWRGDPKARSAGDEKPVMGARVRVLGGKVEHLPPDGATWPLPEKKAGEAYTAEEEAIQACMGYARTVANRANRLVRFVETSDVTTSLAAVLESFHAAKLADHGRGHFLLGRYVPQWAALMDTLAPFGVEGRFIAMFGLASHVEEARESAKGSFQEKILDLRKRLVEASGKSSGKGRGPRSDSMERAINNCVSLVNEAKLYQDILGDLRGAIEADVEAVKIRFIKLASGNTVTYTASDVEAPLLGEAQIREDDEPACPTVIVTGAHKLADGTVVIPSSEPPSALAAQLQLMAQAAALDLDAAALDLDAATA